SSVAGPARPSRRRVARMLLGAASPAPCSGRRTGSLSRESPAWMEPTHEKHDFPAASSPAPARGDRAPRGDRLELLVQLESGVALAVQPARPVALAAHR